MKRYYDLLGLPENATLLQVKKAYRKLARQYHPDKNPDPKAHDLFMAIDKAYDYIVDVQKGRIRPQQINNPFQNFVKAQKHSEEQKAKKKERGHLAYEYIQNKRKVKSRTSRVQVMSGFVALFALPFLIVANPNYATVTIIITMISVVAFCMERSYAETKRINNLKKVHRRKVRDLGF